MRSRPASLYSDIHVKTLKLTGTPLELFLLNYHGDIDSGENNYLGIVKKKKIGKSAVKFVLYKTFLYLCVGGLPHFKV